MRNLDTLRARARGGKQKLTARAERTFEHTRAYLARGVAYCHEAFCTANDASSKAGGADKARKNMQTVSVNTLEYEIDVAALLTRRLQRVPCGTEIAVSSASGGREALVRLRSEAERDALCEALAALLLRDAANFELARIINDMPLTLEEKQRVLPEAIKTAHEAAEVRREGIGETGNASLAMDAERVKEMLRAHFDGNDHLNLEGFLRFRMQDVLRAFELYALCAAEELMLQTEYLELMRVLSVLVRLQQPRVREVSLILHADGSCTITDDTDARIECEGCGAAAGAASELVNLLVALAPARIIVYDLSCGCCAELSQVLLQVFEDRVSFFR